MYNDVISHVPGEREAPLDGIYHIMLKDVVEPTPQDTSSTLVDI